MYETTMFDCRVHVWTDGSVSINPPVHPYKRYLPFDTIEAQRVRATCALLPPFQIVPDWRTSYLVRLEEIVAMLGGDDGPRS